MSMLALNAKDTTGPTPGIVIKRRQTSSSRTINRNLRWSLVNISRSFCRARRHDLDESGHALDKPDPLVERDHADDAGFAPEVAAQAPYVILDGDGLVLQQLAGGRDEPGASGSSSSHAPAGTN
jgi:hypothetical protein